MAYILHLHIPECTQAAPKYIENSAPPITISSFMLDPEAYRTLGIGLRSIKNAGPLARLVIRYIKENTR